MRCLFTDVIAPAAVFCLCEYEMWFVALRDEQETSVSGNNVLRKVFGAGNEELTVDWRKLLGEQLRGVY